MIEHNMASISVQHLYSRTGDKRQYNDLVTCHTPGKTSIVPDWAERESRDVSKAVWQQQQRSGGKGKGKDKGKAEPVDPNKKKV